MGNIHNIFKGAMSGPSLASFREGLATSSLDAQNLPQPLASQQLFTADLFAMLSRRQASMPPEADSRMKTRFLVRILASVVVVYNSDAQRHHFESKVIIVGIAGGAAV